MCFSHQRWFWLDRFCFPPLSQGRYSGGRREDAAAAAPACGAQPPEWFQTLAKKAAATARVVAADTTVATTAVTDHCCAMVVVEVVVAPTVNFFHWVFTLTATSPAQSLPPSSTVNHGSNSLVLTPTIAALPAPTIET